MKDGEALFLTVNAWRQLAENMAESLTRGSWVVVTGRLRQRSCERNDEKQTVCEIEADDVASLRNATAKITKADRADVADGNSSQRQADAGPWASGTSGGCSDEPPSRPRRRGLGK